MIVFVNIFTMCNQSVVSFSNQHFWTMLTHSVWTMLITKFSGTHHCHWIRSLYCVFVYCCCCFASCFALFISTRLPISRFFTLTSLSVNLPFRQNNAVLVYCERVCFSYRQLLNQHNAEIILSVNCFCCCHCCWKLWNFCHFFLIKPSSKTNVK